jgi:hypothetical protein
MTTDLKPIETRYDGYLFRSRLEARWAVFFDSLGIKYEYEKEGFDLGVAGWYLPDFFLPDYHVWVEIKGANPTDEEITKVQELVMTGGLPAFLFVGLPRWDTVDLGEHVTEDGSYNFDDIKYLSVNGRYIEPITIPDFLRIKAADPDEYDGIVVIAHNQKSGKAVSFRDTNSFFQSPFIRLKVGQRQTSPFSFSDEEYKRAIDQARSARFERRNP